MFEEEPEAMIVAPEGTFVSIVCSVINSLFQIEWRAFVVGGQISTCNTLDVPLFMSNNIVVSPGSQTQTLTTNRSASFICVGFVNGTDIECKSQVSHVSFFGKCIMQRIDGQYGPIFAGILETKTQAILRV